MTGGREALEEEDLTMGLEEEEIIALTAATVVLTEVVEITALIEVVVIETIEEVEDLAEVEGDLPWKEEDAEMGENRSQEGGDRFRLKI